jgi:branched-chain amino acid transport system substrate-binding protein
VHYVNSISTSIAAVLKPAGIENAIGLISVQYVKTPGDPEWANDSAMKDYFALMKKYAPDLDPNDLNCTYALAVAQLTAHVLKQAGDNLTRENIMRQATSLKDLPLPMLLPGVTVSTSPQDYVPVSAVRVSRFDGTRWVGFGEPVAIK